jgi:hypothetical protein
MRKPTHADAELLLHLYEIRREPELREARKWFLTEFKATGWAEIKARWLSHADEDRRVRMTISYWELVGTLVNRGVLHPELFFDHTGEDIVSWDRCKPWIAEARADLRPNYLHQFETMVRAHLAFRARSIAAYQATQERAAAAQQRASGPQSAARQPRALAARARGRGARR